MKDFILILIATFLLVGCSNQLEGTQWEAINGNEVQLLSLDKDTCCIYGVSPATGKQFSIGMKYNVTDNVLSFSPLKAHFESQPTYKIDGDFLIDTKTNVPTFKRITK